MLGANDSLDLETVAGRLRGGSLRPRDVVAGVCERIAARGDDAVWIERVPRRGARRARGRARASRARAVCRSTASRSRSRTTSTSPACRRPPPVRISRTRRPTPRRWCSGCSTPARSSSARPTSTSSRPASSARARRTALPQRFRPALHLRRIELGLRRRGGGGTGELRARHRHGRARVACRRLSTTSSG